MKREALDSNDRGDHTDTSTPKRQRTTRRHDSVNEHLSGVGSSAGTPLKQVRSALKRGSAAVDGLNASGLRTPTKKQKAQSFFSTPKRSVRLESRLDSTPSGVANADRSAKRKSARVLLEQSDDDLWDGADQLAEEILSDEHGEDASVDEEEEEEGGEEDGGEEKRAEGDATETGETHPHTAALGNVAETPKRRPGRPKGAKNKRSPTPEGELPPHERYFFQNRGGPPQTSNNTLSHISLLTHEEYFDSLARYVDPHKEEKEFLLSLHCRSFPQWNFELSENFNICLYGYGSKRRLVQEFADWLHGQSSASPPTIVVVNGYMPNLSIRSILTTIVTAVCGSETPVKLGAQPGEVLEFLQSALRAQSPTGEDAPVVTVLIHSIDAPALRRMTTQALLARLAATPSIRILVTADTPNFSLMWDLRLRDQFNFVFHDCTTFATYDVECNVVDEVHNLLGRRGRRVNGKDGVNFVLKSLPENARNLYRILLTELLSLTATLDDGLDGDEGNDEGAVRRGQGGVGGSNSSKERATTEFRTLYQKASEEFIASSEMMFRTLLKEFHDHQMITSRIDAGGTEVLGVPLSREEMEGVLEDLVLGFG